MTPRHDCTTGLRNEVAYAYNGLGMLTTEYQDHAAAAGPGDPNVRYDPDDTAAGGEYTDGMRLKRLRYPNGRYVHTTYGDGDANDGLSRVAAIRNDNAGSPGATVFAAYSYDGAGRVVVEDYAQPDVRLDLVDLAAWAATPGTYAGLDRFGRIRQQWWRDYGAAADVDKFAYGYDRNSNRLYRENIVSGSQGTPVHLDELYRYDRLNRLQDANRGDLNANHNAVTSTSLRQAWTLDDLGNWSAFQTDTDGNAPWVLDHCREHNQANEIADTSGNGDAIETTTGTDWADPAHDARGNMTTVPKPNDPANAYTCTYDAWNRLVKVADGATTVAEYRYDGLHRRIARLVPDGANWDRTDFYYTRGWQVLEERFADAQPDNDTVAAAAKYQYVWSLRYIDACILRDEDKDADGNCVDAEGAGGSERLYYASGANMEVTAVVSTSGTVQERYTYTPYGQVTRYNPDWSDEVTWANSKHNEILYSGYRYDGETGLYHVRFRTYHPTLGRWAQRDPLGYQAELSYYCYCSSVPVGAVDPTGLGGSAYAFAQYLMNSETGGHPEKLGPQGTAVLLAQAETLVYGHPITPKPPAAPPSPVLLPPVPQNAAQFGHGWRTGQYSGEAFFGPENPMTQDMADPKTGSPGIKAARKAILAAMAAHCGESGVDATTWSEPRSYNYTASPQFKALVARTLLRGDIDAYAKDVLTTQHSIAGYGWTALVDYSYDPDQCCQHVNITFEIHNPATVHSFIGFTTTGPKLAFDWTIGEFFASMTGDLGRLRTDFLTTSGLYDYRRHRSWGPWRPTLPGPSQEFFSFLDRENGPMSNYHMHMVWTESHVIECPCQKQ